MSITPLIQKNEIVSIAKQQWTEAGNNLTKARNEAAAAAGYPGSVDIDLILTRLKSLSSGVGKSAAHLVEKETALASAQIAFKSAETAYHRVMNDSKKAEASEKLPKVPARTGFNVFGFGQKK